eukprot:gnl/TRDRNA2_/TRDRNA2_190026_c0_seq1.p1 gnl/TRDRNA2_/TRDRNA2_190026_c0~~gnl/TRDRNA2_/TRDRNA2_190026_c0_seq1.p1  ORF type:complete len:221 (+),score=45.99 gnl/TRDRNA2_/TRDRNA2_190026_c0_seq1:49-663(+)
MSRLPTGTGGSVSLPAIAGSRDREGSLRFDTVGTVPATASSRLMTGKRTSKASEPDSPTTTMSKHDMLKQLSRETRIRKKVENEVLRLRQAVLGNEAVEPPLTKALLERHQRRASSEPGSDQAAYGERAIEVLRWKRLVQHSEKRQLQEERETGADQKRPMKITQGHYARSDARREFKLVQKAKEAQAQEARGSLRLGAAVALP